MLSIEMQSFSKTADCLFEDNCSQDTW